MSIFEDLRVMHVKFDFPRPEKPRFLVKEQMKFRCDFLEEELQETIAAYHCLNLEETIDGLIDLIVVAAGTLDLMGVDAQKHWDEVHYCNMQKVVGETKRGYKQDLKKPPGWKGPNHKRILDENS